REHRALRRKVQLGEPDRVEPPTFRGVHQVKSVRERLRLGRAGQTLELVEDSELHDQFSQSGRYNSDGEFLSAWMADDDSCGLGAVDARFDARVRADCGLQPGQLSAGEQRRS